jgi:hypothetical protein
LLEDDVPDARPELNEAAVLVDSVEIPAQDVEVGDVRDATPAQGKNDAVDVGFDIVENVA